MALSEHEQRLLDEMERGFYQSEADVVETSPQRRRMSVRSLVLGIVVAVVAIGVMIGGVAAQQLWLGLVGFAMMVGGVLLMLHRETVDAADLPVSGGAKPSKPGGARRETLSERAERRWDDRMNGNDR